MISLVVAHDEKLGIGKDGWMPWHLPEDLKHFKKVTLNQNIVMGRTTFEGMKKPLPKRHTYVITNNKDYKVESELVTVVNDFNALLNKFKDSDEVLYITGGAKIYTHALPYVDEMWISLVDGEYEADTYFPSYNEEDFILKTKERKEGFSILHYLRKK